MVGKTCRRRQSMNRRGAGAGDRSTFLEAWRKEGRAGGLRVVCISLGRRGKSSSSKVGKASVEKRCDLVFKLQASPGGGDKRCVCINGDREFERVEKHLAGLNHPSGNLHVQRYLY